MRTWDVGLGTWNLSYFLSDHLGSTSVVLDANGAILEQQRYLPFGQARVTPPYASVTSTDLTYTGQRDLPDTGLMDYKARFYSPTLGRFIQPDTIIPGAANPQSWNRFSYVRNNPIIYNDPTGHKPCDEVDENGKCIGLKTLIKKDIESKYKVKIKGKWDEDELLYLSDTLTKLSTYAGGAENLNDIFLDGMQANGSTVDRLTFKNTSGNSAPCTNGGWACWNNKDTISISDFIFTPEYQIVRQKSSAVPVGIQMTIAHEVVHVFADARPAMVGLYAGFVDNPTSIIHQPTDKCKNECIYGENMASVIAKYIITGHISTPDQLEFVLQTQHYWEAWP